MPWFLGIIMRPVWCSLSDFPSSYGGKSRCSAAILTLPLISTSKWSRNGSHVIWRAIQPSGMVVAFVEGVVVEGVDAR